MFKYWDKSSALLGKRGKKGLGGGFKAGSQESWGGKVVLGGRFDARLRPVSVGKELAEGRGDLVAIGR